MPFTGRALLLLSLLALAYIPSFRGVFVFDDHYSIVANPTIRDFSRLDRILLTGPEAGTVAGRPVANVTLALNHAVSGLDPWSYHALNLLIHVAAALTLAGILRRTFERPPWNDGLRSDAPLLAWLIAFLWALHPLQVQSVTYIVQRVESLMGLFYLLTLYCFIRGARSSNAARWHIGSFVACLLGMGTKEVMVSAPLIVLLYDRTFLAQSWREVWQKRRTVHLALGSTWLLLAVLVISAQGRGGSAGFGTAISWWHYALTQCYAIVHYLRLALWPHPLVFDYGTFIIRDLSAVVLQAVLLLGLLVATVWALVRRRPVGLLGAWFFLILAPSSSVVPIATQTMSEHRMYLPLVAVVLLFVLGVYRLVARYSWPFVLPLLLLSAGLTAHRNTVYASELSLWQNTAERRPTNPRAHTNLGLALLEAGQPAEAAARFQRALRLQPDEAIAHLNLCAALNQLRQPVEALSHGEAALRLDPSSVDARVNMANSLVQLGQLDQAVTHYQAALSQEPEAADIHLALATVLLRQERLPLAIRHFELALRLMPERADTWLSLARAHTQHGDLEAAQRAAEHALRLQSDSADAHYLLGALAVRRQDFATAIRHFGAAVDRAPTYVAARNNLANALLIAGRIDDAINHYREILRLTPDDRSVQENLTQALEWQRAQTGR